MYVCILVPGNEERGPPCTLMRLRLHSVLFSGVENHSFLLRRKLLNSDPISIFDISVLACQAVTMYSVYNNRTNAIED